MPWVITNNKNYIAKDRRNQIFTTRNAFEAVAFREKEAANNYCKRLPKSLKNLNYHPVRMEENRTKAVSLDNDLLDPNYFIDKVLQFNDFLHEIIEQRPLLAEAQKQVELEIIDIEHAAELHTLNAAEGYNLYRMLHEARIRRRQYKDAIARIDIVMESNAFNNERQQSIERIKGMENRIYRPRALPELFKQVKNN